jgi:hypothetical protein
MMISFVFLQMNHIVAPYCTNNLNQCQTVSLTAQFFALFVGIMIHVTAGSEQEADLNENGSEPSTMSIEKSVINTVILISNFAVVVFPLSLIFEKDSIVSNYWKLRDMIDNLSCWKMAKFRRNRASVNVIRKKNAVLSETHLQCDVVKSDLFSRDELQLGGDFVQLVPHDR